MSYKIKLEKGAELDIDDEALFYYKTKVSVRIARNFKKEVKDTLRYIKMNPFYRFYHKDFRGIPLKKYPYIIFYKVNEKILGVFH